MRCGQRFLSRFLRTCVLTTSPEWPAFPFAVCTSPWPSQTGFPSVAQGFDVFFFFFLFILLVGTPLPPGKALPGPDFLRGGNENKSAFTTRAKCHALRSPVSRAAPGWTPAACGVGTRHGRRPRGEGAHWCYLIGPANNANIRRGARLPPRRESCSRPPGENCECLLEHQERRLKLDANNSTCETLQNSWFALYLVISHTPVLFRQDTWSWSTWMRCWATSFILWQPFTHANWFYPLMQR